MPNKNNSKGRLIAADFLTYTVKAFLIGIATSLVLGSAVILLAQSASQDDATFENGIPVIDQAK